MENNFKDYAKKAKERLKGGFWQKAKQDIEQEKQVAATLGVSQRVAVEEQKRKLVNQIYNYDGFCREREFDEKVAEILSSSEIVTNPIMRLADKDYMATLTPEQRQSYIARIAMRYREAVERYNKLHG